MQNVERIYFVTDGHIPEVFWLKLMALDAHDHGLMSVDGFPINLEGNETTVRSDSTCKQFCISLLVDSHFVKFHFVYFHLVKFHFTPVHVH